MTDTIKQKINSVIDKIKEKSHIIVVVVITVYLIALATKTAHVIYTEHFQEKPDTVTEALNPS